MKFINNRPLPFLAFIVIVITALFFLVPMYKVWYQHMAGKAEYARADYNRKIKVIEAEAERDASLALATADSTRAIGRANKNQILIKSLEKGGTYMYYLWLEKLENNNVIYVPTEGNLPIMEAGRLNNPLKIAEDGK